MLKVPISLGDSRAYLATDGKHTHLPSGATLVEPTDGQPIIVNSDGRYSILPPEQPTPAVPVPKPDSPHPPKYEAGHARTDYILPIGLTTAVAAVLLAAGMLTGTIGQIVRGINPGIPPPVAAANSRSSTDLDEIVEATATATPAPQLWTPTPTSTPTPQPTATPAPDPLGILPLYNAEISGKNPEHTQAIIRILDYVQQRLLGKNALGREIPIVLGNEKDYNIILNLYGFEPEEMEFAAYTFTQFGDGRVTNTVFIADQRHFVDIVMSACNEWIKPYIRQQHPRTSNLVVETAGLFGEVSCYRALEELGYTFHKPNDTLGNRYYLSRLAIPNLERGGGFGRDAVRGTWVLAEREPGIIGAIDEGRLLTADELVRLALTAGNQNADGLKRSVDDYTLKPGLVTRSALNKLGSEKERSPLDTRIIRDPVYLAPS